MFFQHLLSFYQWLLETNPFIAQVIVHNNHLQSRQKHTEVIGLFTFIDLDLDHGKKGKILTIIRCLCYMFIGKILWNKIERDDHTEQCREYDSLLLVLELHIFPRWQTAHSMVQIWLQWWVCQHLACPRGSGSLQVHLVFEEAGWPCTMTKMTCQKRKIVQLL